MSPLWHGAHVRRTQASLLLTCARGGVMIFFFFLPARGALRPSVLFTKRKWPAQTSIQPARRRTLQATRWTPASPRPPDLAVAAAGPPSARQIYSQAQCMQLLLLVPIASRAKLKVPLLHGQNLTDESQLGFVRGEDGTSD